MTHVRRSLSERDFYEGVPSPERMDQAEEQVEIFRRARLLSPMITNQLITTHKTLAGILPAVEEVALHDLISSKPSADVCLSILRSVDPYKSFSAACWSIGDSRFASRAQIYEAIEKLYLSRNMPRDRRIADRLTTLYRDAVSEGENIRAGSVAQFVSFLLQHMQICVPKITLTPDGTVRSRWIHGTDHLLALEFTGDHFAKIAAELPREKGETARYFGREQLDNVLRIAEAMGATVR